MPINSTTVKQSHKHKMKPLPMLKELREDRGLSQRALAKRSGVAHDTISQIEQGKRLARASTAQKLADALGTHPHALSISLEKLDGLQDYIESYGGGHTARILWEDLE